MIGKKIVAYLSNNMSAEGIVQQWKDDFIILSTENSPHQLIINNPTRNLILFKILNIQDEEITEFKMPETIEYDYSDLPKEETPDLTKQSLLQLKKQRDQNLRKALQKEMNKFHNAPNKIDGNFTSQFDLFKKEQ